MLELLPVVISGQDDALQDGDAEGERLAGARAGLADEIGALNGNRDGHGLDGEGRDDPHPLQRLANVFSDAEIGERGGNGNSGLGQCLGLFVRGPVKALCHSS